MDSAAAQRFVENAWSERILPALRDYITIPNQSPFFDPQWREHGHMERAVGLVAAWVGAQNVPGLKVEVVRLEGRTPLLLLHGFTGHAHAWDTLSIALQPHFRVLALDQRGHGESDPAETYGAIVAFDDISGVIAQLGLSSLVLVGLSGAET